jgi:hypothetical protein
MVAYDHASTGIGMYIASDIATCTLTIVISVPFSEYGVPLTMMRK